MALCTAPKGASPRSVSYNCAITAVDDHVAIEIHDLIAMIKKFGVKDAVIHLFGIMRAGIQRGIVEFGL